MCAPRLVPSEGSITRRQELSSILCLHGEPLAASVYLSLRNHPLPCGPTRSGVNFPLMLYRLALGEPVEPGFACDVGLEFRWLLYGELLHLAQTRDKRPAVGALLHWRRVATNVSLTDPLPHIVEGLTILRGTLRRLSRNAIRKRAPGEGIR